MFFGGIIVGVVAVAAGALALWGPENDIERRREGGSITPSYASAAAAADSALAAAQASAEAIPTVLPETPAEPPPIEVGGPPKKATKKRPPRPKR